MKIIIFESYLRLKHFHKFTFDFNHGLTISKTKFWGHYSIDHATLIMRIFLEEEHENYKQG